MTLPREGRQNKLYITLEILVHSQRGLKVYVDRRTYYTKNDLKRPFFGWILFKIKRTEKNIFIIILDIYRVSQEECARLRESVPYVKLYRYNPKHLYPKLNGYGDNGHRKV